MIRILLGMTLLYAQVDAGGPGEVSAKVTAAKPEAAETLTFPDEVIGASPRWGHLQDVTKRYAGSSTIKMDVEKTVTLAMLGREKKFAGELFLKKERARLELQSKEISENKSLFILGATHAWAVTESKGQKTQVYKKKLSGADSAERLVSSLLSGTIEWDKVFKLESVKTEKSNELVTLQPKNQDFEYSKVALKIDYKDLKIQEIQLWDALENQTVYRMSDVRFNKSLAEKLFQYTPPKDVSVVEVQ